MAQIYPSDIPAERPESFDNDEYATLLSLRDGLPDDYAVYHSVHWTKANPKYTAFGEIDFVVLNKSGDVLFIEQKNGRLAETSQGLVKRYGNDENC